MYKTTITIYSDFDPSYVEIDDLARDAMSGDSICESQIVERIEDNKLPEGVANFFRVVD